MTEKRSARPGAVFKVYTKAAGKYPWLVSLAVLAAIGVEITGLVTPLYLRQFINILSSDSPSETVIQSLFVVLGMFALTTFIGWIFRRVEDFSLLHAEARVMRDLYTEAFEKLMQHSHEFFISNFTGTLTRRVTRYARSFEQISDTLTYAFLPAAVFAVGAIGILAMRSIELGAGLLVWTITFTYFQFVMAQRLQPLRLASTEADSAVTGTLSDAVTNHSSITTFAMLRHEQESFRETIMKWSHALTRSWSAQLRTNAIQGLMAVFIEVGLLVAGVFFWKQGVLTVGDFVLIQVYILGLMDRVWGIGRSMRNLYDAIADATEMLVIIDRPRDISNALDAKSLAVSNGGVEFVHVRFAYQDGQMVLNDCNIHIASHEKVAIVGSSGAGKTTITKLLLRLYDISGGAIRIDGQDISQVTQESLRQAIAFVPQDPALFHRTLMENIRYGREKATDAEVIEAAKQAHCLEFIEKYPDKFNTMVGERGVKLSGGERQRVAIARAILKDAPILVLDEATSSLDSESEALIQDALTRLMEGKTVIAIAHRLSTIMHMDRIIVMEDGKVVLSGTHDELLAQENNLYKKLWGIQAGGFISDDDGVI